MPENLSRSLCSKKVIAWPAFAEMRRQLIENLTPRLYCLIGVAVAGLLRCDRFVAALRGPLEKLFAAQAASDWRALTLTAREKSILTYTEKGTLDEASVRRRDVDELRAAGLNDKDVLLIATAIAYHNYSLRMAAAFDVLPRYEMCRSGCFE